MSSSSCTSSERFISFYIVPAICTVGIIGNIVNLIVFTRQRMREIVFVYLTALAIFDLLVVLVGLPVGFVRCGERPVWSASNSTALPYNFMPAQSATTAARTATSSTIEILSLDNSNRTEGNTAQRAQTMFDNFTRAAVDIPTTAVYNNNMMMVVAVDSFDEYDANERDRNGAVSSSFAELFAATQVPTSATLQPTISSTISPPVAVGTQRLTKYAVIFYEFYLLRGLGNFSIYAAIFVTLAMTAERYWTIRRALKQLTLPTSSKLRATIILSTVVGFSLLLTIPRYFMYHIVTLSLVQPLERTVVLPTTSSAQQTTPNSIGQPSVVTTNYAIRVKDSVSPTLIDVYEFLSICIHFLEIFILFTLNTALIIILRRRRRRQEELTSGNTDASTLLTKTDSRRRRFASNTSSSVSRHHNNSHSGGSSSGKRRSTTTTSRASSTMTSGLIRNGGKLSTSHCRDDSWRNNKIVKAILNKTGSSDHHQTNFNSNSHHHRPSISINEPSSFHQSIVCDDEQPSTVENIALMPTTTRQHHRLSHKNSGPATSSTENDEFSNNNTNDSSNSSVEINKTVKFRDRKSTNPSQAPNASGTSTRRKLIRLESTASAKQETIDENPVIIVDGADDCSSYRPYEKSPQQQRGTATKTMVRQNSTPASTRRQQRSLHHQPSMHRAHSHDVPDNNPSNVHSSVGSSATRHVRGGSWSAGKLSIVSNSSVMTRGASLRHQHTVGAYSTTSVASQSSSSANTTRDDVTRMLVYLIVLHLVCHFLSPITASTVAKTLFGKDYIASDTYRFQVLINNLLNLINNSMNFFVYITTSKRYRRELSAMYRST